MKRIVTMLVSLALMGMVCHAQAQETVRVKVQLIAADQTEGTSDDSLSELMPQLQRMLPEKRFQQKGNKTVSLSAGKDVAAEIGGHTMTLKLLDVEDGRARVQVNWTRNKKSVIDTIVKTQAGAPFVVGGPREGKTTWIAVFSVQ
jgi:hypothetical protein